MRERTRYLRRPRRGRLQRWAEGLDPWHPRPIDIVFFAGGFLVVALAWVGVRTAAVQLNRRLFRLEERALALAESEAVLGARVNALADRGRVVERAERELGMVVPKPEDFRHLAVLPSERRRRH
jgi:hypothetical protein